jgi:hypothetical protein
MLFMKLCGPSIDAKDRGSFAARNLIAQKRPTRIDRSVLLDPTRNDGDKRQSEYAMFSNRANSQKRVSSSEVRYNRLVEFLLFVTVTALALIFAFLGWGTP